ncbi:THUMP domain-containing protein [Rutstroemia sp. NJR-2017a BBW]|nr:THUMP domain-containing protein [Rutstroemia sp. NJR-2017a BBW]
MPHLWVSMGCIVKHLLIIFKPFLLSMQCILTHCAQAGVRTSEWDLVLHSHNLSYSILINAQGGSNGKWKTPHQQTKMASMASRGGQIEPGDQGIFATCIKGKEGKATEELRSLFEECAERFYDISARPKDVGDNETDSVDDIEASIQAEVAASKDEKLFPAVYIDIQCVLFFKTPPPIDPVDFVRRICEAASSDSGVRKLRFVNRLTPMTLMGKATEKGIEEVGNAVLGAHFRLAGQAVDSDEAAALSYAIRPTIRNHSTLKRDAVIKQIASLVGENHKVNLTKPDKTICGMSVVGEDWERLKRYNLYELTSTNSKSGALADVNADATPESVSTNEARAPAAPENPTGS